MVANHWFGNSCAYGPGWEVAGIINKGGAHGLVRSHRSHREKAGIEKGGKAGDKQG